MIFFMTKELLMAARDQSTLGFILDSGILRQAARQLEARLANEPDQPELLRQLADLYRKTGQLEHAARQYERLRQLLPGDAAAARLSASLTSRPLPPAAPSWPPRFVTLPDFLPAERLEEILTFAQTQQRSLTPSSVYDAERGAALVKPGKRSSSDALLQGNDLGWFVQRINDLRTALAELLQEPAPAGSFEECRLTCHGDGCFFKPHIDATPHRPNRLWSIVYYFYFPPQRYSGGELILYDWDHETGKAAETFTTIIPRQNLLVAFSSSCWHEVLPVRCTTSDWTAGRFTLNGWIHR